MHKTFCDSCGKETKETRQIWVKIPTNIADKPNKPLFPNAVFYIDVCDKCFTEVCDDILRRFGKSSKDIK